MLCVRVGMAVECVYRCVCARIQGRVDSWGYSSEYFGIVCQSKGKEMFKKACLKRESPTDIGKKNSLQLLIHCDVVRN
jgi:hypothetical protein